MGFMWEKCSGGAAVLLLALLLAGCSGSAQLRDTSIGANGSDVLTSPESAAAGMSVPDGVSPELWAELNAELYRQLAAVGNKKAAGQLPPPEKGSIDDLKLNVEGTEAWLSWTYKNPGDYDLNGEVNQSDLVPIAQRYLARRDDAGSNYLAAVDGDGNGEINQGDIATIAQNWGNELSGYAIGPELGDADGNGEINESDIHGVAVLLSFLPGEVVQIRGFYAGDVSDFATYVTPGSPGQPGPYACALMARPGNGFVNADGVLEFNAHLDPTHFLENFQIAVIPVILNSPPYTITNPVVDEENMGEFAIVTMPAPVEP